MIVQFVIGYLNHRIFMETRVPSKLHPIHVWLGRVLIPCGIANGFLGFPLALNTKYNWALLALTLLVIVVICPFIIWRFRRDSKNRKAAFAVNMEDTTGYQARPWIAEERNHSDIDLHHMNFPGTPRDAQFPRDD